MVTPGVDLNIVEYYGRPIVPKDTKFTVADIKAVLEKRSITLRTGDVVLFNTGWLELIGKDDKTFLEVEPALALRRPSGSRSRALSHSVETPGRPRYIRRAWRAGTQLVPARLTATSESAVW